MTTLTARNILTLVRSILSLSAVIALGACQGYSYTLNQRTVYEPPKLFNDYAIADDALRACVAQAIEDGHITQADALLDLNCSNAGIANLAGIEVFAKLRRLGLDDNRITDLAPLHALKQLELVQVRNNALRGVSTQLCEGATKQLALAGNGSLECAVLAAVSACGVKLIDAPAHCP